MCIRDRDGCDRSGLRGGVGEGIGGTAEWGHHGPHGRRSRFDRSRARHLYRRQPEIISRARLRREGIPGGRAGVARRGKMCIRDRSIGHQDRPEKGSGRSADRRPRREDSGRKLSLGNFGTMGGQYGMPLETKKFVDLCDFVCKFAGESASISKLSLIHI